MKNIRKVVLGTTVLFLCLTICLMFILLHVKNSNEESFDKLLSNPEKLFHGVFNTSSNDKETAGVLRGDDISVSFINDNIHYDEKNLIFAKNENGRSKRFTYYFIRHPEDTMYNKATRKLETIWYLCKFDDVNSIILLDENNEEIGRISFIIGKEDWLGKRKLKYYLVMNGKSTPIYKRESAPYGAGTFYLKSKYYSGKFLDK